MWLMCVSGKYGFKLRSVMNSCVNRLQSEGSGSSLKWFQVNVGKRRRRRIEQKGCQRHIRRNLFKQLDPLPGNCRLHDRETSCIAGWSRQALDETAADGIGYNYENDRDCSSLLQH